MNNQRGTTYENIRYNGIGICLEPLFEQMQMNFNRDPE